MIALAVLAGIAVGYVIAVLHIYTRLAYGPLVLKCRADGSRVVLSLSSESGQ